MDAILASFEAERSADTLTPAKVIEYMALVVRAIGGTVPSTSIDPSAPRRARVLKSPSRTASRLCSFARRTSCGTRSLDAFAAPVPTSSSRSTDSASPAASTSQARMGTCR